MGQVRHHSHPVCRKVLSELDSHINMLFRKYISGVCFALRLVLRNLGAKGVM